MNESSNDKGTEGEQYTLEKVNAAFELMGECEISRKRKVKNNVILPFKSIYSGVTAEIDIIVITPYFIFPIEVKNCHYSSCNYGDQCWKGIQGEETSNPLIQNQNHKAILCSELGVPPDKVISIVVLLQDGKQSMTTELYKNCYVLDGNELQQNLMYLFATEDTTYLDTDIYERFSNLHSRSNSHERDRHNAKIKYVTAIQEYAKKNNFPVFSRYLIARCEVCNSGCLVIRTNLVKEDPLGDRKIKIKRKDIFYALGCTNSLSVGGTCSRNLIYLDNKEKQDVLNSVHIEEIGKDDGREERVVDTVLNKITKLEKDLDKAETDRYVSDMLMKQAQDKRDEYKKLLDYANKKIEENEDRNKKIENANRKLNCVSGVLAFLLLSIILVLVFLFIQGVFVFNLFP